MDNPKRIMHIHLMNNAINAFSEEQFTHLIRFWT